MINILVTGSNGQLGSEIEVLSRNYDYDFFFTTKEDLDIRHFNQMKAYCNNNNITHIINGASYTAVDAAENEKELVNSINYFGVKNLAQIAKENSIFLIHLSTDYVFNGTSYKPCIEDDIVNPINFYGKTKLDGEKAIKEINPTAIIIRTSWLYSSFGDNFVKTMLKLSKIKNELNIISDQIGTPTYARDLAKVILEIIQNLELKTKNLVEIYHFSNEGVCSWYDFAKTIFEIKQINIKVNPITTEEYLTPAKRPYYSVLNKSKIKKDFNIEIPYWRDSLKECLEKIDE